MINFLKDSNYEIRYYNLDSSFTPSIDLKRDWQGKHCKSQLNNNDKKAVRIKEIVLFKGKMPFDPSTEIYGEGYSMLSQYIGTVEDPTDLGKFSDRNHYKLPIVEGLFTVNNLIIFMPENSEKVVMAFSSCRHYSGEIRFNKSYFEIVIDFECLEIKSGEIIQLEDFFFNSGDNLNKILNELAQKINQNHPKLEYEKIPTGWCSWYSFGSNISQEIIYDTLKAIKEKLPDLKYIQIDEGYAAYEGDWLMSGKTFPDGVKELCLNIKRAGFEPAMWIGPFFAEINSQVFKEHPEWFKTDEDGTPLLSNKCSFGGWYHGPWYMLDGTHPGAQDYLRHVFKTMREEWQVKYFKMDANMWGALPFGKHYDQSATRIDAYHAGMRAILEGAGEDSFLLSCNAPMWPSLGTVHGMRITDDAHRGWSQMKLCASQMYWRNWQHGKLWINDPDCINLENREMHLQGPDGKIVKPIDSMTQDECLFRATTVFASGGMVLSGDNFMNISQESIEIIKKIIPPSNKAAVFDDTSFTIGRMQFEEKLMISVFNREDEAKDLCVKLNGTYNIKDYWSNEYLGQYSGYFELKDFNSHSGRVYECIPVI